MENGATVGAQVPLHIDELGIHGLAAVVAVHACPEIAPGRGRVVTGTVSHSNGYVWRLAFRDDRDAIEATDVHPFYSLDRADWVGAVDLREGEAVQTLAGRAALQERERLPGIHRVYNLEVEGEHCFYVGDEGLLVHNSCLGDALGTAGKREGDAAHHIVAKNAEGAKDTKKMLEDLDIDIDEAANGVWLPTHKTKAADVGKRLNHNNLHTKKYYETVHDRIRDASKKAGDKRQHVLDELARIGQELTDGTFKVK